MSTTRRRVPPAFPAGSAASGPIASRSAAPRQQRPPMHAAGDPRRVSPALGVALESPRLQATMVERLRDAGLTDARVVRAMATVPRHHFIDSALAGQAYEDTSLPIGHGQTISKPSVVARMLELLFEGTNARAGGLLGRVLEIGTGCGYQAAVLALISRSVISVERLRPLHELAREKLAPLRSTRAYAGIRLVYGDGRLGHSPNAPYDTIIAAAVGDELPRSWLEQLAIGGRLVAPLRCDGDGVQRLEVVDRDARGWRRSAYEGVRFVPLESGLA